MNLILEYIWIGGNTEIRSKTKVIKYNKDTLTFDKKSGRFTDYQLPDWNYDGSSTWQATGDDSEVMLKPMRVYVNPFSRLENSFLVLCETYLPNGEPHYSNTRIKATNIFNKHFDQYSMFGIEHEFFVINSETKRPVGFPREPSEMPEPQGPYYCSVGYSNTRLRDFMETTLEKCLTANINITG